jgi:hypothetical protein
MVALMLTIEECWTFARECSRWAVKAKSEDDRSAMLDMAKIWTQLALQEADTSSSAEAVGLLARPH